MEFLIERKIEYSDKPGAVVVFSRVAQPVNGVIPEVFLKSGTFKPKIFMVFYAGRLVAEFSRTNQKRRFVNTLYVVRGAVGHGRMRYLPVRFYTWVLAVCLHPLRGPVKKIIVDTAVRSIGMIQEREGGALPPRSSQRALH